jgi:TolB protein
VKGIWRNTVLVIGLLSFMSCVGSPPERDIVFVRGEVASVTSHRLVRMGLDGSDLRPFLADSAITQVNVPDWAPEGSRLLFTSGQRILVAGDDGSGVRALEAGDFSRREWPAWSPDGTEILFNAGPSGSEQDLYVMTADGLALRQLTADLGREYCGRWSPDGARIVFTSLVADTFRLMVMDRDGTAKEPVLPAGFEAECADWSPDGDRLAFSSTPGYDFPPLADFADWAAVTEIYVLDIGTGEVTQLTALGGASSRPRWSPDGRRVVFHSSASIGAVAPSDPRFWPAMEIYVSSENGSDLRRLTDNQLVDIHPSW